MKSLNELIAELDLRNATGEKTKVEMFNKEGINPDFWTNEILGDKENYPLSYAIVMEGLKSSNSESWYSLVNTPFSVEKYQVKTLSNGSLITIAVLGDGRRISVNKSFVSLIEANGDAVKLYVASIDKAEIKQSDGTAKTYASCTLSLENGLSNQQILNAINAIQSIDKSHLEKWDKALKMEVQPVATVQPVASVQTRKRAKK